MGSRMLIDATHAEETRVVVVRGNRIEEFDFESAARKQLKGNIYLAKVTRVEPSLQAAFVEYGGNRHGFLAFSEIHPDYYQIPMADRQALIREQEEEDARDDDDNGDNGHDNGAEASAADGDNPDEASAGAAEFSDTGNDPAQVAKALETGALPTLSEEAPLAAGADEAESEESDAVADSEIAESAPATEHGLPADMGNGVEVVEEDAESRKVESVGAEDVSEEMPRRQRRAPRRSYKIQEVIKRRQIILVQVVKEERGNKGAALTTYLSLAGRYCVLMPNTARGGGISRKITDAGDRRRLKEVARDVEVPQGMGLIVRTAGAQRTRPEIKRDFDYLMRLWENVRDLTLSSTAPALVYEEGSLIKRSIRDLYTKDVDEVMVEGDAAYREAKDFMKMLMPSHAKNVKLYKEPRPLFSRYQTETQLDTLYSPTVTLPSGGYLVINQTEALVSIDINSGKATREHNIEDTALKTNLEACDEIARQLRLRDLAGLVVIDFIDMEENRNNRSVERRLKEALKNDRARIQVGRISHFGLMEMSRQRLRPGLLEGSSRPCPHCEGRGIVRSISSCGLSVLRAIEEHLMNKRAENLTVKCPREVAFYVLNEKRDNLLNIEQTYGISVFIVPSDELKGSQAVIERAGDREHIQRRVMAPPVRIDSAFPDEEPEEEVAAEAEDETETSEESSSDGETDSRVNGQSGDDDGNGGRRRRRRGRRGGRRGGRDRGEERGEGLETARSQGDGQSSGSGDEDEDSSVPAVREPRGDESEMEDRPTDSNPEDAAAEPEGDAGEGGEADGGQRRDRGRRGRRDRFGRNRNRGDREGRPPREDRGERPPREDRGERPPREDNGERRHRREEPMLSATPPQPAPVIIIPEPQPDPEPRKWQPPAANVTAQPAERKAGWWSKRK